MPNLPEQWSNDQVLGFFRLMWQQWLLKSGRGVAPSQDDDSIRGPAPPAAVAAAALNQVLSREMQVSYMVDEVLTDAICPAGIGVSKIAYEAIMRPVQVKPPGHAQTPCRKSCR